MKVFLDQRLEGNCLPTKYHYDKKKPAKHKKAHDLEYKGDDHDIDAINKKMAKKFGGKYKKLKEEEETEE